MKKHNNLLKPPHLQSAMHGARFAALKAIPLIRQLAGRGAGNIAKKVGQRGVKKTGKILETCIET